MALPSQMWQRVAGLEAILQMPVSSLRKRASESTGASQTCSACFKCDWADLWPFPPPMALPSQMWQRVAGLEAILQMPVSSLRKRASESTGASQT